MQLPVPIIKVTKGSNLCQLAAALMVRAYYGDSVDTEAAEKEILDFFPFTLGLNERHTQGIALWLARNGYTVSFAHHDLNVLTGETHPPRLEELREVYHSLPKEPLTYRVKKLGLDIQVLEANIPLSHTLPDLDMLDRNLAQNIPTLCIVKQKGLVFNPLDHSTHGIVVIGKEGNDYIYNDNQLNEPQRIHKNKLLQAWYSCGAYTLTVTR